MDDDMTFSEEGMLDYDGTSGFDAGDMSAFTEDTLFASHYSADYGAPSYGGNGTNNSNSNSGPGLTPGWLSVDTPGKYPRNDSSVTAIMANTSPAAAGASGAPPHQDVKPRSLQSSTSPDSSSQDSPASSQSSGRRKRKSPTSQDTAATDSTKITAPSSHREGPPSLSPTYDPRKQAALRGKHVLRDSMSRPAVQTPEMVYHEQSVDNISSAMNHSNLFDFDSAASSPGAFGNGISATAFDALNTTPRTLGLMQDTPKLASADTNPKTAKFFFESRENSPLTAMSASHHASPVAMFSTDSPQNMHTLAGDGTFWPAQARAPHFDFNTSTLMTPSPVAENMSMGMNSPMTTVSAGASLGSLPCQLSIRPFNNKSRVETQIPVVLTMSPMPTNVSRVHLQSHTISKPKLLAKEPQKTPDALELYAAVVCTSAMQKPHLKERALKRAAGIVDQAPIKREGRRASAGDADDDNNSSDPNEPLNGGDVKICSNCVNRERKRAARKKAKKQEDEDHWSQFEQERIVVFNTSEYKDWQPVTKDGGPGDGQQFPDGAMYVEVPMRIACYCRHQSEKIGFQVIFTIKDWQDRVLAQNISDSILITDDHKTQPAVGGSASIPSGEFNFSGAVSGYNSPELRSASFQQHRPYHSTNDLQALRSQFNPQAFPGMPSAHNDPGMMMQASSTAATPRNLSRPASPTFQAGSSKRRKGSSVHVQIPTNLRMTQRTQNNTMAGSMGGMGAAPMSAGPIMGSSDPSFAMTPLSAPQYQSQPPTPNSNTGFVSNSINRTASSDNMQMYQFYSTPHSQNPSRGPSRVPSPVMSRPNSRTIPAHQAPQTQLQSAMGAQGMHGISFSPDAQQPQRPTLTRLNPREGPLTGNIQVDIHGTGFRPGINVLFGKKMAQFSVWNEGALIAMVPPGDTAGPVEVTIQDPNDAHFYPMQSRRDPLYFTYTDDREPAIWELFGRTMFEKQFGHTDVNQARALLSLNSGMTYGYGNPTMQMNFSQMQQMKQRQAQTLAAARASGNTEDAMLQLLSVIDLDDSPFAANFDMRFRNTGTTVLAMASGLGYTRLVAGLVARGAMVDTRDRCGYTPLMLAAMRGYRQIVRLLARRGADPTIRNRVGFTAADLANSTEIASELAQTAQHVRQRSIGGTPAFGSRANSVAFADNPYLPVTPARSSDASLVTDSDDSEAVEEIDELPVRLDTSGLASRRSSLAAQQQQQATSRRSSRRPSVTLEQLPMQLSQEQQAAMMMPPIASMTAWHNQLLAQVNRLQQSVSDIQFAMPNIQDSMMVRRFSSMMPFSASTPPPPYEEKDPAKSTAASADEKVGLMTAAAEAALDDVCDRRFGAAPTASAGVVTATATAVPRLRAREVANGQILVDRDIQVSIGKKAISREQQQQLRLAHQARLKSGRSDWKVWVIWLPLLIVVALLMMRNMLPQTPPSFPIEGISRRLVRFLPKALLA